MRHGKRLGILAKASSKPCTMAPGMTLPVFARTNPSRACFSMNSAAHTPNQSLFSGKHSGTTAIRRLLCVHQSVPPDAHPCALKRPLVSATRSGYDRIRPESFANSKRVMSTRKSLSHATSVCLVPKFGFNLPVMWGENAIARRVRIRGTDLNPRSATRPMSAKSLQLLRRFLLVISLLSIFVNHCFGQAPFIVNSPLSQEVSAGVGVALDVEITGAEPFTYQWFRNGQAVPGAEQQTLVFEVVSPVASGSYTVRVLNRSGSATSKIARLQLTEPTAKRAVLNLIH
jgi:hypothetical protein